MTRIALVLGGGVSLGSYIGGALTEILGALAGNTRSEPVRIHVITGGSAGALNAGVAARALAVNPGVVPWLEKAWLDAADARHLLNPQRSNRTGMLDVGPLEQLATALIAADPASDDAMSPAFGSPLRLGLTLSSLDGIRYDFRYGFLNVPDRTFGTRTHSDWIDFELPAGIRPDDAVWKQIRDATLASAAFPFAFPPRRLTRQRADYSRIGPAPATALYKAEYYPAKRSGRKYRTEKVGPLWIRIPTIGDEKHTGDQCH